LCEWQSKTRFIVIEVELLKTDPDTDLDTNFMPAVTGYAIQPG